jgi:hypothetical protein
MMEYEAVQLPLLSQLAARVEVIEVDGEADRTEVFQQVAAALHLGWGKGSL